ncbi:MAG: polysaccharide deacetylase family protein [Actinomycetota bacterium]|nr:polysaccharide deacetylase family protein [Actinomycetota bacterium]
MIASESLSERKLRTRQLIVGILALPLSLLPFAAYFSFTAEGRSVRDRVQVAIAPPELPKLSREQVAAATEAAPRYKESVMILAYHGVGTTSDAEGGYVVSPERLAEHLAILRAAGMHTVTARQVADSFRNGAELPSNAVMISFDDGRSDAMMFADPLLQQAGMVATMFVITNAASEPGVYYAGWDDIEAYSQSGRWDIEAHTAALHREQRTEGGRMLPALTSLTAGESLAAFRDRIRQDLARASAAIEAHVGDPAVAFAYPFGAYGKDRSNHPAIARIVRQEVSRRYLVAFQQDEQDTIPLATCGQIPLELRRLEVESWSGMELLERIDRAAGRGAAAKACAASG